MAVTSHLKPTPWAPGHDGGPLSRYVGRSGTIRTSGTNSVDVVTGATATSKAITAGSTVRWPLWQIWIRKEEVEYVDSDV